MLKRCYVITYQAFREAKSVFFSSRNDWLWKYFEIERVKPLGTGQSAFFFLITNSGRTSVSLRVIPLGRHERSDMAQQDGLTKRYQVESYLASGSNISP